MTMLTPQSQFSEQTDCYIETLSIEKFEYDNEQSVLNGKFLVRCGDNQEKYFVVLNSKDGLTGMFRAHYAGFHRSKYTLDGVNLAQDHKQTPLEKALISQLFMNPVMEKSKTIGATDVASEESKVTDTTDGNSLTISRHDGKTSYKIVPPMHFVRELTVENEELKQKLADSKEKEAINQRLIQSLQSQLATFMGQKQLTELSQDLLVLSKS